MKQFFGKYRGKVTSTQDPMQLGRIQVSVPVVLGEGRHSWAMPCVPYAGKDIGLFTVPPIGSNIWVEFEGGNPDYPIWSGCFWGKDELPQNAKVLNSDQVQVFKTDGITITLSNFGNNKGLSIEVSSPVVKQPLKVLLNDDGIEINNNNQTTGKWTADTIELKNGQNSTVTIAADSIQIQENSVEIKLTGSSIELINSPSTAKLTTSAIEMANGSATVKIAPTGIESTNSPATVKIAPSEIELSNGAANIKLSPLSVNINNGALEVI